ncbi:MAG: bifunctional DNA-formamidopyrimidine glycosylase/DNA-(apurinic or apyrimidinic site) lyase [Chloroflexi bacterium]|nr:bifunctional DNA-formamidopyrimidine glycosylase/DNA-(apurinic or apyrimidinic site) lyase [Chloroflexota bacterium]
MPELPEVETVVRRLRPELVGRIITRADVYWPRTIESLPPAVFCRRMRGQTVTAIDRRAKYLLFRLSGGATLVAHLRMTGDFSLHAAADRPDGYARARFVLDDGRALWFSDTRKFGRLALTADPDARLSHLGPEPLARQFTPRALAGILSGRPTPIKPFLLDQGRIAGLGNIYADEALHHAAIDPRRPARDLTAAEAERLHAAIQFVLRKGIRLGGSTLHDGRFRDPSGKRGKMQDEFVVYHDPRREQKTCPRCGTRIAHTVIAQRSAHYCPGCQR